MGIIFFLLIIGILVYFILAQKRGENPFGGLGGGGRERPIDIVNKRYAKGEISKEEYERLKNDLQS